MTRQYSTKLLDIRVRVILAATVATMMLTSCRDSGPSLDEAYNVGYDMGLADECSRRGVVKQPMPSAYDDSLGEGKLESAFQSGYWAARNETRPCK
ncbi:hypothetical protein ACFL17_07150 [Pseudomonadota bacterium]